MDAKLIFPSLDGFEPTRQTLQLYSRVVAAIPRSHGQFHPRWRHISLKVQPDGLITAPVALPDGGTLRLKMGLVDHQIVLTMDGERLAAFGMADGISSSAMADKVLGEVAKLGLSGEYDRARFENPEPRVYDPDLVSEFLKALVEVDRIFEQHRATLPGEPGPVQFWSHGFDLAFEWFGTRVEVYEENGEPQEIPAQLNLGFFPGGPETAPYFYSNPWPFEGDQLLGQVLPEGASWHTEGWQGTILPYEALKTDPQAEQRLLAYAERVFELAAPTISATDRETS
jgi:hypothetical protein